MKILLDQKNMTESEFFLHHPFTTGLVILPTPQIADLCAAVYQAVMMRQLGLCLTAKSGMGKTFAIRYLETFLAHKMPKLVVFNHISRNHRSGSVRGFFKHFLTTVGHPDLSGETSDLRSRLCRCIVDRARVSQIDVAVMLIDEAQSMSLEDFTFLKDTANEIENEGISLITVLMAQEPDFSQVKIMLESSGRLDLMSRFTLSQESFRAFETLDDLASILRQIDNAPYDESGLTWTASFLPIAYAHGFRLERDAEMMFKVIKKQMKKHGMPCQFPARQLFSALRRILMDSMAMDDKTFTLTEAAWLSAIARAKLIEAASLALAAKDTKLSVRRK